MRNTKWTIYSLGLSLAMAAGHALAATEDWEYVVESQFLTTPGATAYTSGVQMGCRYTFASAIAWGACPAGPALQGVSGRSGIGISDNPQTGLLNISDPAHYANTFTHHNNIVASSFSTLTRATLGTTLGLRAAGTQDPFEYFSFVFGIRFVETPNETETAPCVVESPLPCSDIWVFENLGNHSLVLGGDEYLVNFFLENDPAPLPAEVCATAYPELLPEEVPECFGFTTAEQQSSAMRMVFDMTYVPLLVTVSGRVYAEGSSPANTQDNGAVQDPGVLTQVAIQCTGPAYNAGPISTAADGTFSFDNVPAEASCTITSTPPSGYQAAYLQQGTSGTFGAGGALNTTVAGSTAEQSIGIVVPRSGSSGNALALRPMTDMQSTTSCTPNPAAADAQVSCTTVCTNLGTSTALHASCTILNAASLPGNPVPVCSSPANLSSGETLTCSVAFTMPASGSVLVSGGTAADNDSNGGAEPSAGNNPSRATVALPGQGPATPPTPVPGLGALALLLLSGLLGWAGLVHQRRSRLHSRP